MLLCYPPTVPETDSRSDEDLVALCNRGDEGAFEALYRRHRDWVVRLAWRATRNDEDALDVLQETFAYVLGKLPSLTLTAKFTSFLYPVVTNLSIAARRKRERLGGGEVADRAAAAMPPGGDLEAALAALPEGQREVLLLRYVDDMSLEEVASALGIPVGTVKSRIHHALAALRTDARAQDYLRG